MTALISPEMLDLQRDLHARYAYGIGADAEECLDLISELLPHGATVLDYGCGQGSFARIAGDRFIVSQYDPAIAGRDALPEPAQGVVCADVLEHVEESHIAAVVKHIHDCMLSYGVLIIATGNSAKIMADGRQAHVLLRDEEWWRLRLCRWFSIERCEDRSEQGNGLLFIVRPLARMKEDGVDWVEIGKIKSICAVDGHTRDDLLEQNSARIKGRVFPDGDQLKLPEHGRKAILACYGPSLADTWHEIHLEADEETDIFTASAAHRFLTERGIVPYAHLECDPRPHKATQMGEPLEGVKYWFASCVSKELIDKCEGHEIALWHAFNGPSSIEAVRRTEPNKRLLVGGGSIGLRGLSLLYYLGYRTITAHGLDCSFKGDQQHAGEHHGKAMPAIDVHFNGRVFQTSLALVTYYRYFLEQMKMMHDATLILKGDGMLQHSLRTRPNAVA